MAKIVTCDWPESDPITYLDHYEVWRKTGSGGTYAKISGDLAQGTLTYVDSSTLADSTQYFYEVRAYNATGDYNEVEDSITISGDSSTILFEDDFAGTTINVTTKWDFANPDSDKFSITQNDEIIVDWAGGTAAGSTPNYLIGKNGYDVSTNKVITFDLEYNAQNSINTCFIGLQGAEFGTTTDLIIFGNTTTAGSVRTLIKVGDSAIYDETPTLDIAAVKTVKIAIIGANAIFSVWSGSSWTELGTVTHTASGSWKPYMSFTQGASQTGTELLTVDNLYITDGDFSTQYPI